MIIHIKKKAYILIAISWILTICSLMFSSMNPDFLKETQKRSSTLEIHYIDVGQGDCTLVVCDGEALLIDAGDNSKGTAIQLYLTKHNVEKIKYVIGTHPDSDHIGGMDVILYKFDCENVIMPDIVSDTKSYRDVIDTMKQKNISITKPVVGDEYTLGQARFVIMGPQEAYLADNNNSVAIRLEHGNNSFIFTGDAEYEAEMDYLQLDEIELHANVLQLGHHGSSTSTNRDFLEAIRPEYAVISCGRNNSYGHPHQETLLLLKEMGIAVFRTDEQGSIVVTSDGKNLEWSCSPSISWNAGGTGSDENERGQYENENSDSVQDNEETKQITYVLNMNTKKFHYPDCPSVDNILDKNRLDCTETREVIIEWGYVPCKRCKP